MSCDNELANEWARCSGKNASYITIEFLASTAAPEIWIGKLSQGEAGRGKAVLSCIHCKLTRKALKSSNFHTRKGIKYARKGIFNSKTPYQIAKSENYETFWAPTSGNSLVVRQVSPSRKIVLLFWTKYVVSHQIKPGIVKLTIRWGLSTICIVAARTAGAAAVCKVVLSYNSLKKYKKNILQGKWVHSHLKFFKIINLIEGEVRSRLPRKQ